ncbi:MAG: sporadic carbohydrate cluster protein, TIGR04323 family [Thermoanaerobaculia bacterium]|nr:sporadic carbohydrate cluster protein, TIGR04323 family [Thermoanaerobaculia bacterium]
MSERDPRDGGYRGYIASRPILGHRTPQHVQNLVIRNFTSRHGLAYRLSAAEYAMPGCYLMLEDVLQELEHLDGMIAYSLFMLPRDAARRRAIWHRILDQGTVFYAAVEELRLANEADIERLETLIDLRLATEMHGVTQRELDVLRSSLP